MESAATSPRPFGKYQIIGQVSVGPVAEVYKATLEGLGGFQRTFAIKRILKRHTTNPQHVTRIVDEAKLAGLLSHANIVQILDLGHVDDSYYIAMEYVSGFDLDRILARCVERGITIPVPHAAFIAIEVLKALEYAHHRQVLRGGRAVPLDVVHTDVSPTNILVSRQGEIKVTDFGVARAARSILQEASELPTGFFDYLAPEAIDGQLTPQTDLFALGVVLYELLTGRHPFSQPSNPDTVAAIRSGTYAPMSTINPDVPKVLEDVVVRALSRDPKNRFEQATQMKEALDRFFLDSGFIFNQNKLGSYLRDLLGEGSHPEMPRGRRTARAGGGPGDSTGITIETSPEEKRLLDNVRDHNAFSTGTRTADDPTALADKSENNGGWAQAETYIRPRGPITQAEPVADEETEDVFRPPTEERPSQVRSTVSRGVARGSTTVQTTTRPWYKNALWLFLAVVVAAFLTIFGALLYEGLFRWTGTPLIQRPPELQVHTPPKAQLEVNGQAVAGSTPFTLPISAGAEQHIVVTLPGYAPIETTVKLEHNDIRILSFQIEADPTIPQE